MTGMTVAERVAAGAALLDEQRPGWATRINLGALVMADGCQCVAGQDYAAGHPESESPFDDAANALGLQSWRARAAHGFTVSAGSDEEAEWAALDAEWRRLITARRTP